MLKLWRNSKRSSNKRARIWSSKTNLHAKSAVSRFSSSSLVSSNKSNRRSLTTQTLTRSSKLTSHCESWVTITRTTALNSRKSDFICLRPKRNSWQKFWIFRAACSLSNKEQPRPWTKSWETVFKRSLEKSKRKHAKKERNWRPPTSRRCLKRVSLRQITRFWRSSWTTSKSQKKRMTKKVQQLFSNCGLSSAAFKTRAAPAKSPLRTTLRRSSAHLSKARVSLIKRRLSSIRK